MLFVVALGSLALGGVLILLIARYSPEAAEVRAQEQRRLDEAEGVVTRPGMPFDEWRHLVIDLLEALGFHIALEHTSGEVLEIIARSTEPLRKGKFLVRAVHAPRGDVIGQAFVLELQEEVRADRAQKGFVLTPYRIDTGGMGEMEDMELIDGTRLRALIEEHMPKKLDAIEGYRGF